MAKYKCDCCDKEQLRFEDRKDVCNECFAKCCGKDQPIEVTTKKLMSIEDLKEIEKNKTPIIPVVPEGYLDLTQPVKREGIN